MTIKISRNELTAKEYSELFQKTKVEARNYPYIKIIKELNDDGVVARNLTISKTLGLTAAGVGKTCKAMEKSGVLENTSQHPLWTAWRLTPVGLELHEAIINKVKFVEV